MRNIVGQIPSLLIRQGILIIGLVLLILLGISVFIPYKKTIPVKISIRTVPKIEMVRAEQDGVFLIDTMPEMVQAKQIIGHILHKGKLMPTLSPISGKITLNTFNNDSVNRNQLLFAVVPEEIKNIYGECSINSSQRAKVKKGQKVLITNDSGQVLVGKLEVIYPIQENENHYKIRVSVRKIAAVTTPLDGKIILQESSVLGYFLKSIMR